MDALIMSIVGWIITIVIAVYAARSGSKDTEKKLAALNESTTRQVESIKALSRQMVEASIKQVELEIEKNLLLAKQAKQELEGIQSINNSGLSHMVEWKNGAMEKFQEQKPERDYYLYCSFIQELNAIKKGLEESKNNLD